MVWQQVQKARWLLNTRQRWICFAAAHSYRQPRGAAALGAILGLSVGSIGLVYSRKTGVAQCDPHKAVPSNGPVSRTIRAFYLRPDAAELQLLQAASVQTPGVVHFQGCELRWDNKFSPEVIQSGVDVLVAHYPSGEELDALSGSLRFLIVPFAGPTRKTVELIIERPHLSLHNCHFNAASTTELAIGLLLAATKRLIPKDARFREEAEAQPPRPWTAGWADESMQSPTLSRRRALVLGFGAIGSRVASVLSALEMEVHAIRRSTGEREKQLAGGRVFLHGMDELHSLLSKSEVVVICLPGTPATEGLLGLAELQALPEGAILVNVGRGSVVREDALYKVLSDGHLGAAGLDVWYNYPMLTGFGNDTHLGPSKYPFHELPNVVMSPHNGQGSTSKAEDRIAELRGMLQMLSHTNTLPNKFNIKEGY